MKELPIDFQQMMQSSLGEEEYNRLAHAIDTDSPTSLRLNPKKADAETLADILQEAEPVQWCNNAYYLKERPQFTFDPLLHAGCYYVQEASSMYISKLLKHYTKEINAKKGEDDDAPVIALDACAAPGGKTTLALATLPEGSLVVANEYVRQRSNILVENLKKWGNPNVIVTNSDTKDFTTLPSLFDIILCDAPCSGEGMFRKDEKAIEDWSMANVHLCQERQREIVGNLWKALRPGGLFIYSTCTFNSLEDEENAQWIADTLHGIPLPLLDTDTIDIPNGHFYPHRVKGEGFFVTAFMKSEDDEEEDDYSDTKQMLYIQHGNKLSHKKNKEQKGKSKPAKIPKELTEWLNSPFDFNISENTQGTYFAFPKEHEDTLKALQNSAHVIHFGIQLATTKGKNLQPAHNLAMSLCRRQQAFPTAEVSYQQAIAYLRTEAISLPEGTPVGYVIVSYKGVPLGFAKNIGNRANNLYPQEWKIKSTYVPKTING